MRAGDGDVAGLPAAKPVLSAETRAVMRAFSPMCSTLYSLVGVSRGVRVQKGTWSEEDNVCDTAAHVPLESGKNTNTINVTQLRAADGDAFTLTRQEETT